MKHGLYLLLWLYYKPINNTEYGDIAYGLFLIPTKQTINFILIYFQINNI